MLLDLPIIDTGFIGCPLSKCLSCASEPANYSNRFERLPIEQVPELWLVYSNSPSDSGAVHSPVKQRWLAGESDIITAMKELAQLAEEGR